MAVDYYDTKYTRILAMIYGHGDVLGLITKDALTKAVENDVIILVLRLKLCKFRWSVFIQDN